MELKVCFVNNGAALRSCCKVAATHAAYSRESEVEKMMYYEVEKMMFCEVEKMMFCEVEKMMHCEVEKMMYWWVAIVRRVTTNRSPHEINCEVTRSD